MPAVVRLCRRQQSVHILSALTVVTVASGLLVQNTTASTGLRSSTSPAAETQTISLRKQYVPIKGKTGSVVAYKTAYFGQIHVGLPEPQTFTVVFDTGSAHLILPSTSCGSETCTKHRRYDLAASGTAADIDHDGSKIPFDLSPAERNSVAITFGSGKVLGQFAEDGVCLGPPPAPRSAGARSNLSKAIPFTEETMSAFRRTGGCTEMRVVLATEMSDDPFGLFDFDGVLGLGMSALSLSPAFSFFEQMLSQRPNMKPLFSVFLARNDNGQSAITFGGHEDRWSMSEVSWVPVALPELGYWQVHIKSVRIGDAVLDDCADGGCRAILDTGTSLLGVPRQSLRMMHRLLARPAPAADGAESDCRTVPGAMLQFELAGGHVVSMGVEDYSRPRPLNITIPPKVGPAATPATAEGHVATQASWQMMCRSLLLPVDMPAPLGPKVFIWGEPMLRRYYTHYDTATKRIGFSVAGTSTQLEEVGEILGAVGAPVSGSLVAGAPLADRQPEIGVAAAASKTEVVTV